MVDYFDCIYSKIINKHKLLVNVKYYSIQRLFIRIIANILIPFYYLTTCNAARLHTLNNQGTDKKIIVSLTTFPARIGRIWIVIESLLRQDYKPDKIILWLSKEQFHSINDLPRKLLNQQKRGLEIRFVEGDIKSHKKYFYCLKEYPDDYLVTVDDDIIYPTFLLSKLIKYSSIYPKSIVCHRSSEITTKNNKICPYTQWVGIKGHAGDSFKIFQTSGGGTLYPPYSLHNEVLNEKAFMEHCLYADDIWLNCMSQLNKTTIVKTDYDSFCLPVLFANNQRLTTTNVNNRGNDLQLHAVRKYCIDKFGIDPFENVLTHR